MNSGEHAARSVNATKRSKEDSVRNDQQNQTPDQTPNLNPNLDEYQRDLGVTPNQNATNLNAINRMREEQGDSQSSQGAARQASHRRPLEQGRQDQQPTEGQMARNESGLPGGGVGRMETPGRTGIYPVSADQGASGDAPVQGEEAFGQGDRGDAGYQDSGGSRSFRPTSWARAAKRI